MKSRLTAALLSVVVPIVSIGCGSTSLRNVDSGRFVAYTVVSTESLDRPPPPSAPGKATSAIKTLKRVAFVPPDSCLDMRGGDTSTVVDKQVLRMQCGVTMSELEREAEQVGFDVVTWQSLKGGSRKPLDQAKELKIELLFEVNELDVVEELDRSSSTEFRYFSGDGKAPPQPLQVTAADNEACKAYHAHNAPKISGMTSVLDLKMVQVATGSVLWSYRHTEGAAESESFPLVRFGVMGSQNVVTRKPWWPWLVVGGGAVLVAVGVYVPGAVVAGLGLIGVVVMPKKTHPVGEPTFESVSSVLCRRPHQQDAPPPVVAAGPPKSDRSDTFRTETKVNTKDATEERRRVLIKKSVAIFMKQLTAPQLEAGR